MPPENRVRRGPALRLRPSASRLMSIRLTFVALFTLTVSWTMFCVSAAHGQTIQGIPNPTSGGAVQPGAGGAATPAPSPRATSDLVSVLSLGSTLDAILKRQPLNDFEAYVHSQEPLWNEAVRLYGAQGGFHVHSTNPYAGKSPAAALSKMRNDYMRQHPEAFKGAASGSGPANAAGGPPRGPGTAAQPPHRGAISDEISQQDAMRKYPALAQEGSPLNREFVTRAGLYRASSPQRFTDPNWPMILAEECKTAVETGNTIAK